MLAVRSAATVLFAAALCAACSGSHPPATASSPSAAAVPASITNSGPALHIGLSVPLTGRDALAIGAHANDVLVAFDAGPDGGSGRLVSIDATTGATVSSWPIGSEPTAIVSTGDDIWVSTARWPGPGGVGQDQVTEYDAAGHRLRAFAIVNPDQLVSDGGTVWVSSFNHGTAFVTALTGSGAKPTVELTGTSYGEVPMAYCGGSVHAVTGSAKDTDIFRVAPSTSAVTREDTIAQDGAVGLACGTGGLLASVGEVGPDGNTLDVFRVPGASQPIQIPSRTGAVVSTSSGDLLVFDGPTGGQTSAAMLGGGDQALGTAVVLPGAFTLATTDTAGAPWIVLLNPTTSTATLVKLIV